MLEETFEITSSHGSVIASKATGYVREVDLDLETFGSPPVVFDLYEWCARYPGEEIPDSMDILDIGYACADGTFCEPCEEWRMDREEMRRDEAEYAREQASAAEKQTDAAEKQKKAPWTGTTRRSSGLVEHLCEHGVGHPAAASVHWLGLRSEDKGTLSADTIGIHGCCGCCQQADWRLADAEEGYRAANTLLHDAMTALRGAKTTILDSREQVETLHCELEALRERNTRLVKDRECIRARHNASTLLTAQYLRELQNANKGIGRLHRRLEKFKQSEGPAAKDPPDSEGQVCDGQSLPGQKTQHRRGADNCTAQGSSQGRRDKEKEMTSTDKEPVLCYVADNTAFFTTRCLAEQWGDDWSDAPYEHNAGTPYTPCWHNEPRHRNNPASRRGWRPGTRTPYEPGELCQCEVCNRDWHSDGTPTFRIDRVMFIADLWAPCDVQSNSPYSVQDINAGIIPWLVSPPWSEHNVKIMAGTPPAQFKRLVREAGGSVFTEEKSTTEGE